MSLEDSGQAFSRFIVAGKDIGLTTKEAGLLADTTLKLGRIGGATTQEMTGGMIQLGQALAANRLGGDEFRSVMENLPLVARAIAKEMGVNVGALKDVAAEGKITADVIANALFGAMKDVDKQFKELPQTASAMAQQIQNEWTLLLSDLDSVFGGSSLVKNVYGFFRDAVKGARDMIAPSDDQRVTDLESEIAKRRKNIEDRNNSFWKSPAFDDQDRQAIERA